MNRTVVRTLQYAGGSALLVLVLFLCMPLGYALSWVDFTYGTHGLDPAYRAVAVKGFGLCMLAAFAIELVFRAGLLRRLCTRFRTLPALVLHLVAFNVVFFVPLYRWGMRADELGFGRFVLYENLLQGIWALMYLRTRSVTATALVHGIVTGLRFMVLNDIASPFETLYFYTSSSPIFYWTMLLAPVPLILAVAVSLWREGH